MKWNECEIKILKENYSSKTMKELMELLPNRTSKSIEGKALKLKLKKENKEIFINPNLWDDKEIKLLKENYPICGDDKLKELFPNRTIKSIHTKAERLELKKIKAVNLTIDSRGRVIWDEYSTQLFIDNYSKYSSEELIELFFTKLNRKQLYNKARKLGLKKTTKTLQRKINSDETKIKISQSRKQSFKEGKWTSAFKNRVVTEEEKEKARQRVKGKWTGSNNPRHKNPLFGKDNGRWNGGITNLSQALRENIYEWKQESMEVCNFKCLFTGNYFNEIHHLYPFNNIIKEVLDELNLEVEYSLGDYSIEEQENIKIAIKNKHIEYGLGVCLSEEIHKLYHDNYGYISFNVDSFKEFIEQYFNGKYDDILKEKFKSINSLYDYNYVLEKLETLVNQCLGLTSLS